jgi:type IV secretory pathway VirB4 component
MHINPFELPQGTKSPSPQKIKFLISLFEGILTDTDADKLPKLSKSLLEEAILKLYETHSHTPKISDFAKLLSDSPEKSLQDFSKMLYPWTGNRPYGRLLDKDNSFDVHNKFVVFDLKGLSNYPDLQSVMILIITDYILGKTENNLGTRKRILMDECWQLLKQKSAQDLMEYYVRAGRKTGTGITFITQGLEEIIQSPIGGAILSNTSSKFILKQQGDLEPVKNILKLNDQEITLIRSLRQSKGHYSEAFLSVGDNKAIMRCVPTPLEYWLATSDAKDNEEIEKRNKTNKSLKEIILELAEEYPYGISQGKAK